MREIKSRTEVVVRCLREFEKGGSLTGFRESDIELSLLQLRKCLELVMYSLLVAHYHAGLHLQRKILHSEWNATKILKFIETKNPLAFPRPLDRKLMPGGEPSQMIPVEGALTRNEFCKLYDQTCGKYLHAARDQLSLTDHPKLFYEIGVWHSKLVRLLNSHWVIIDQDTNFAVLMDTGPNHEVQVALAKASGPFADLKV